MLVLLVEIKIMTVILMGKDAAALEHILSYHHVNFGDKWTTSNSVDARAFAIKHECYVNLSMVYYLKGPNPKRLGTYCNMPGPPHVCILIVNFSCGDSLCL